MFTIGMSSRGLIGIAEMLTPIDQPLDKLDDLTPEEMCVHFVT